jgi:hypothetical protein
MFTINTDNVLAIRLIPVYAIFKFLAFPFTKQLFYKNFLNLDRAFTITYDDSMLLVS